MADEGDSTINRRRGLWVDPAGGGRSFIAAGRNKKVDRTCYMCGSPDHFIRDCPVASTPHPMFQTGKAMFQGGMPGYASSFWNDAAFPPIRPYMNVYRNPAMMPFNANMVPITPYAVPQYVPSMYGGFPIPKMGGLAPPVGTRAERPLNHSEFPEIWDCENRRKLSNDWRGQPLKYEDGDSLKRHHYDELERADEYKSHTRDKSLTRSEDSRDQSLRRKHRNEKHFNQHIQSVDERYEKDSHSTVAGRERRSYHSERSNSGVEDVHHSTDRYCDSRYKQHHRSYKKHHESRGQSGSDSSRSRHYSKKERVVKKKLDVRDSKHRHDSHSSSGLEPRSSADQKKRRKETDHMCSLRDSRDRSKPTKDKLCSDRWQMASGSGDDFRDGYDHHKRKRVL